MEYLNEKRGSFIIFETCMYSITTSIIILSKPSRSHLITYGLNFRNKSNGFTFMHAKSEHVEFFESIVEVTSAEFSLLGWASENDPLSVDIVLSIIGIFLYKHFLFCHSE